MRGRRTPTSPLPGAAPGWYGNRVRISRLLKEKSPLLSFEFFPPRNKESERVLADTVESLARWRPDFVSVTYGAGGGTCEDTLRWTLDIRARHHLTVMMHLTCIASSRAEMEEMAARLRMEGIDNLLALRGDPPRDLPREHIRRDFPHASDLVAYLRGRGDWCIGVAGYPETHPEAASPEQDLDFLKRKVDAGADFVITQLFFDNRVFLRFRDRARRAGIAVPLIPGLMPIVNLGQIRRFTTMCGASIPPALLACLEGRGPEEVLEAGVEHASAQCRELIAEGAAGIHLYTLNRDAATGRILERIQWRSHQL
jgi:methylenetetrahydrofolate reductase (NADPH)